MCRLLLMNASAFSLINHDLEPLLHFLMESFGGHGNGVAALWPDGKTQVAKAVRHDEVHSAMLLRQYRKQGASWFLFHTRRASIGRVLSQNCHPFQFNDGTFVLAHNGHDQQFAQWGHLLNITDSECIARTWSTLHLPVHALADVEGVFMGFHDGKPFVVKGSWYSNLVALRQQDGDGILLASELPDFALHVANFDVIPSIGSFIATSEEDLSHKRLTSPSSSRSRLAHPISSTYDELFEEELFGEPLEEEDQFSHP